MYDLIIIGGGPAGYHGAEIAARAGMSVLLFEKRELGGVCLNEGCIPTKALLYTAKLLDNARAGKKYGVTCGEISVDYASAVRRKDKVVKKLVAGVREGLKHSGVTLISQHAVIKGRVDGGFEVSAGENTYTAKKLLLCAGSEPVLPPIDGLKGALESGFAMTNREILELKEPPERLAVIGGGVIGLEMASLFNSMGTKVTVVELLPKIAGPLDAGLSEALLSEYRKKGVDFLLQTKLVSVGNNSILIDRDGKTETLSCDKILMSVGRRAVSAGFGLESIGVPVERGAVLTDDHLKTGVPDVYAAGDINGKSMLAHTAYREAEVAVNNILGKNDVMRYDAVPSVIYTNPEAAGVGETIESAKAKGINAREVKLPMAYSGRFLAENEGAGGLCTLVWNGDVLIGVHMLGNPCSEIVSTAASLIASGAGIEQCRRVVFPHPSVAEILHEAFFHS